ncbi:MAG: 2-amino-4-hydroxy-6-hydroxymethyldihydropteridine diphosphokinase [Sphingobium sp.]|nr:2-amino-4-hydroxy-6-hydroxymethyldihydropteridine diphosphokinase [Sphingobium sp.]
MPVTSYALALGSNRRGLHGGPAQSVRAALAAIGGVVAVSAVIETVPVGPSQRRFANMAAIVETIEAPDALLARLKAIERGFGRRRGQRWGARVIDIDIILWSGGIWASPGLTIPHPAFRLRGFVLRPLAQIAPAWRDPVSGRTIRQLVAIDRAARAA